MSRERGKCFVTVVQSSVGFGIPELKVIELKKKMGTVPDLGSDFHDPRVFVRSS